MSTKTKVNKSNENYDDFFFSINRKIKKSLSLRLFFEFLASMTLIFTINIVFALGEGENGLPFFKTIYQYNILSAFWIALITVLAFAFSRKTTISSNFINLIVNFKGNHVNKKEFYLSMIFQFIGGIFAAIIVYYISHPLNPPADALNVMGGTIPKIKGLTKANINAENKGFFNPWTSYNFVSEWSKGNISKGIVFMYSALQGLINSILIIVLFILNRKVDENKKNITNQLFLRYIILVIGISITTIFYANTTNWVRLLSPAIINAITINSDESLLVLQTTILYIFIQFIGIIFAYFIILSRREIKENK